MLEACIRASIEAEFERQRGAAMTQGADDAKNMVAVAKAAGGLFSDEVATYSPLLAPHLPTANQAAARTLHACFGAHLQTWLLEGGCHEAGHVPSRSIMFHHVWTITYKLAVTRVVTRQLAYDLCTRARGILGI